jgi:hypothetical protein
MANSVGGDRPKPSVPAALRRRIREKYMDGITEEEAREIVELRMRIVQDVAFALLIERNGGSFMFSMDEETKRLKDQAEGDPEEAPTRISVREDDDGTVTVELLTEDMAQAEWLAEVQHSDWGGKDRKRTWVADQASIERVLGLPPVPDDDANDDEDASSEADQPKENEAATE